MASDGRDARMWLMFLAIDQSFKQRAAQIADHANNTQGAMGGDGVEFLRGLDEMERERRYSTLSSILNLVSNSFYAGMQYFAPLMTVPKPSESGWARQRNEVHFDSSQTNVYHQGPLEMASIERRRRRHSVQKTYCLTKLASMFETNHKSRKEALKAPSRNRREFAKSNCHQRVDCRLWGKDPNSQITHVWQYASEPEARSATGV